MLCTSGFVDDVMFIHNAANTDTGLQSSTQHSSTARFHIWVFKSKLRSAFSSDRKAYSKNI